MARPAQTNIQHRYQRIAFDVCVPALGTTSLLSVRKVVERGRKMTFTSKGCALFDSTGKLIANGKCGNDGLYEFETRPAESSHLVKISQSDRLCCADPELWHNRLGHRNYGDIEGLASYNTKGMVTRRETGTKTKSERCPTCAISKAHKQPFPPSSETRPTEVLSLVVSNICGKMQVPSIGVHITLLYSSMWQVKRSSHTFFIGNQMFGQLSCGSNPGQSARLGRHSRP